MCYDENLRGGWQYLYVKFTRRHSDDFDGHNAGYPKVFQSSSDQAARKRGVLTGEHHIKSIEQ